MKVEWAMISCEQKMIVFKNNNEVDIHKIGFDLYYQST